MVFYCEGGIAIRGYIVDSECCHKHRVVSHSSKIAFALKGHFDEPQMSLMVISVDLAAMLRFWSSTQALMYSCALMFACFLAGTCGIG